MANYQTIKLKEVKFSEVPTPGGLQLWNPAYRHKHIEQVERETKDYTGFYNTGYFCRETSTIHLFNI